MGRKPLPEGQRKLRAVYYLTDAEKAKVDAYVASLRADPVLEEQYAMLRGSLASANAERAIANLLEITFPKSEEEGQ